LYPELLKKLEFEDPVYIKDVSNVKTYHSKRRQRNPYNNMLMLFLSGQINSEIYSGFINMYNSGYELDCDWDEFYEHCVLNECDYNWFIEHCLSVPEPTTFILISGTGCIMVITNRVFRFK
jgi:hypothetical protein